MPKYIDILQYYTYTHTLSLFLSLSLSQAKRSIDDHSIINSSGFQDQDGSDTSRDKDDGTIDDVRPWGH